MAPRAAGPVLSFSCVLWGEALDSHVHGQEGRGLTQAAQKAPSNPRGISPGKTSHVGLQGDWTVSARLPTCPHLYACNFLTPGTLQAAALTQAHSAWPDSLSPSC